MRLIDKEREMTTTYTTLARNVVVGDTIITGPPVHREPLTVTRIETDGTYIRFNGLADFRADVDVTVQAG